MQKKLIALAVAGLVSAPAFAQSNVTVYGVADAYMGFGDQGDTDLAGVQSGGLSGSRLGFRGTEDLGNGLKGVFTVEQGFSIDTGAGMGNASRQAFVGVAGGFGAVTLGRQYAPGYDFQYDALVSSALSPQAILAGGVGSTIAPNSAARWNNSVAYNGMFSGLKVRGIYSMNALETSVDNPVVANSTIDPSDDDAMGLGVEYANGPLKVGALYHYIKDAYGVSGGTDDQQEWLVGGSYNFGVATLAVSYQDAKNLGTIDGIDGDIWQVGVIVPVGAAGNVHLAYGELDADAENAGLGIDVDGKSKSYSIAYTHALSKRTTAYVGYNRTDNDTGLDIAPGQLLGAADGEESDYVAVGVRHTF